MAEQEKPFKALQDDERIKKLQRRLKLNQIKGFNNSLRLASSPQSSTSVISSIQGDSALSDVSYCGPSLNSSRAGSVITSSINLKKVLSQNVKTLRPVDPSTSSVIEQSLDDQKMNSDKAMMPPPSLVVDYHKQKSSNVAKQKKKYHHESTDTHDSMTGASSISNYDSQASCSTHNSDNSARRETAPIGHNASVKSGESPKEGTRSNETSKKNSRVFMNWVVRLNDYGQICIKGKLESGEHVRSKAVKRRLNATTVLSVMNHKYHLLGNIYDSKEELPEYIRGKFFNGFPTDWENVRQIWQSYITSGCSRRFRWPRPIADSDDDLLSDITDLPISQSTKTEALPKAPFLTVVSNELATETATNRPRIEKNAPERRISETDLDVASVPSAGIERSNVQDKTTEALETSCKNAMEQTSQTVVDLLKSNNQPASATVLSKAEETVSQKSAGTIPKWKIDVIVDNMMDKSCPNEYIHKVVEAINCINELFTMSSTDVTQTTPNEGVSANDSNVDKINGSKDKNDSKCQYTKQTAAAKSFCSSLSSASSSESEPELPPKKNTYTCREPARLRNNKTANCKSPESLKSQVSSIAQIINPNRTDVMSNNLSESSLVRVTTPINDSNHQKRKDNLSTPTLSRAESPGKSSKKSRYNEKLNFDITDSEMDMASENNARTSLVNNNSYTSTKAFRRISAPKNSPVTTEKIVNKRKGISGGDVDSDISIIDCYTEPCHKTTSINTERRTHDSSKLNHPKETLNENFQLSNNDHVQTGTRLPEKSLDSSNANVMPQKIGDLCTVRLTKINLDQHNAGPHNNGTPSRPDRVASLRKRRKVDSGRENNKQPESDSENFNMRMSSRGRHILPRLDYWTGERVFLRDQKLVYSPGIPDSSLSSGNSTLQRKLLNSPNKTTVSESTLPQSTAKKLNITPKVSKDWSQFDNEYINRNASSNAGILSEITENQESTWTRDRRSHRKLLNKSPTSEKQTRRTTHRHGLSSSEDEGATPSVARRKRRKIY